MVTSLQFKANVSAHLMDDCEPDLQDGDNPHIFLILLYFIERYFVYVFCCQLVTHVEKNVNWFDKLRSIISTIRWTSFSTLDIKPLPFFRATRLAKILISETSLKLVFRALKSPFTEYVNILVSTFLFLSENKMS